MPVMVTSTGTLLVVIVITYCPEVPFGGREVGPLEACVMNGLRPELAELAKAMIPSPSRIPAMTPNIDLPDLMVTHCPILRY